MPLSESKSKSKRKNKRNKTGDNTIRKFVEYGQQNQTDVEMTSEEISQPQIEFIPNQDSENSQSNDDGKLTDVDEKVKPTSYSLKFMQDADLSKLICEKVFEKLSETINPINMNKLIDKLICDERARLNFVEQDLWRYKELASFVLVSDIDKSIQVLCLGTGTKCLSSEHLSLDGNVVQDSHAEVIARRSLIHILYDQLESLLANNLNGNLCEN